MGLDDAGPAKGLAYIMLSSVVAVAALKNNVLTLIALSVLWIGSEQTLRKRFKTAEKEPLPNYMSDLTEHAKTIKKCPYSGFDDYIKELEVIAVQKEKNCGVLVGLAGIGKSAVFETLAWKIAHKQLDKNSPFAGKRLISISAADLVADCQYRGMLEARVKALLKIAKDDPNVIYYNDEIHKIVGAGATHRDQNNDLANQLKPALARPGLTILGASTPHEFEQFIENDQTLIRRFKKIEISPPNPKKCLKMLQERRAQDYYNYNGKKCQITDDAFKAAIFFARKDNPGRQLPDVANDLIDDVCARASLESLGTTIEITLEMILEAHAKKFKRFNAAKLKAQFDTVINYGYVFDKETAST